MRQPGTRRASIEGSFARIISELGVVILRTQLTPGASLLRRLGQRRSIRSGRSDASVGVANCVPLTTAGVTFDLASWRCKRQFFFYVLISR